jgi:hypothetical protein
MRKRGKTLKYMYGIVLEDTDFINLVQHRVRMLHLLDQVTKLQIP